MLDTLRPVSTPELIELELHPAGVLPRALAWLIDQALRLAIIFTLAMPLSALGRFGMGLLLILFFVLEWFYPVLFEVLGKGATPGKRALNLIVLHDDGTPIGWGASMTRNLLRVVDFLPVGYAFGVLSMLLHTEFRRLGDIVAGTVVSYRSSDKALPDIAEAEPVAPGAALDRPTQRALLAFAERAPRLTPARQEELAELVPHLSQAHGTVQGAQRLLGLANHLLGRRA